MEGPSRAEAMRIKRTRHCERSEAIQFYPRAMDCFVAEPVIGPATSGRTRWLFAMTAARRYSIFSSG